MIASRVTKPRKSEIAEKKNTFETKIDVSQIAMMGIGYNFVSRIDIRLYIDETCLVEIPIIEI
jgi:hypothetical protein